MKLYRDLVLHLSRLNGKHIQLLLVLLTLILFVIGAGAPGAGGGFGLNSIVFGH